MKGWRCIISNLSDKDKLKQNMIDIAKKEELQVVIQRIYEGGCGNHSVEIIVKSNTSYYYAESSGCSCGPALGSLYGPFDTYVQANRHSTGWAGFPEKEPTK